LAVTAVAFRELLEKDGAIYRDESSESLLRSEVRRHGVRCRPRSGHRADEDTRITSDRERGTTTAVRSRTARLPSLDMVPRAAGEGAARGDVVIVGKRGGRGHVVFHAVELIR
jgi:hypothetical protein